MSSQPDTRKEEALPKIIELMAKEQDVSSIMVAKALNISVRVAGGYLSHLSHEGRIIKLPPENGRHSRFRLATPEEQQGRNDAVLQRNSQQECYNDRFWNAFLRKNPIPEE